MREILFRGKAIHSGEWHCGMFCAEGFDADFPCIIPYQGMDVSITDWHVDLKTVGQFTGLHDKNGTKIFEGDIVKSHYDDAFPEDYTLEEIVFNNCAWCTRQVGYDDCNPREDGDFAEFSEVVGNIYDNPELLKGGTE